MKLDIMAVKKIAVEAVEEEFDKRDRIAKYAEAKHICESCKHYLATRFVGRVEGYSYDETPKCMASGKEMYFRVKVPSCTYYEEKK